MTSALPQDVMGVRQTASCISNNVLLSPLQAADPVQGHEEFPLRIQSIAFRTIIVRAGLTIEDCGPRRLVSCTKNNGACTEGPAVFQYHRTAILTIPSHAPRTYDFHLSSGDKCMKTILARHALIVHACMPEWPHGMAQWRIGRHSRSAVLR